MSEPTPIGNRIDQAMQGIVFRWVGPIIGTIALALGGWAHGKISSTSDTTIRHEAQLKALEDQHREDYEWRRRMESKIDNLRDLLERPIR